MNIADAIGLLLYSAVIWLCGTAIRAMLCRRELSPNLSAESIATNVSLGLGVVPWVLLLISMLGGRPNRRVILVIGIVSAAICILSRRPLARGNSSSRLNACAMPAISLLIVQAVLLVGLSLLPTYEQDAVAIWGLKARVLFFQPLLPRPEYFSDLSLSFTHLDYPLLLPMLWAGTFAMLGQSEETISKWILLLPILCTAGLIYGFAVRRLGKSIALILAALTVGSAATTRWAAQGVADPLLAMFILAATLSLIRFIERQQWSDACVAGLFAGFAANTKLEGVILLLVVGLILLVATIARSATRGAWSGLMAAVLVYLPWLLWSRPLPHTHENYQSRLSPPAVVHQLHRLPEVLAAMWAHFHLVTWWPVLLLPLASVAANARAALEPKVLCVWLILLALLAADGSAYLVTPWQIDALVITTMERLLLQVTPLLILLATLHWQVPMQRPSARPPSFDPP